MQCGQLSPSTSCCLLSIGGNDIIVYLYYSCMHDKQIQNNEMLPSTLRVVLWTNGETLYCTSDTKNTHGPYSPLLYWLSMEPVVRERAVCWSFELGQCIDEISVLYFFLTFITSNWELYIYIELDKLF